MNFRDVAHENRRRNSGGPINNRGNVGHHVIPGFPFLHNGSLLVFEQVDDDSDEETENEMEFPMKRLTLESIKQLRLATHAMRNFIEASAGMDARVNHLPEQIRGGSLGFEMMTQCSAEIAKKMKVFIDQQQVGMMSRLGDKFAKQDPGPITTEEWVKNWVKDKNFEDLSVPEDDLVEACLYCSTNHPNVVLKTCTCSCVTCATCMLTHYYRSTNQTQMTESHCPTCRAVFGISDIIPSKAYYVKDMIKDFSTGRARKDPGKCGSCEKNPGDSHIVCCERMGSEMKCAECLIGELWEEKFRGKESPCIYCKSTSKKLVVHRTYKFATPSALSIIKRKRIL